MNNKKMKRSKDMTPKEESAKNILNKNITSVQELNSELKNDEVSNLEELFLISYKDALNAVKYALKSSDANPIIRQKENDLISKKDLLKQLEKLNNIRGQSKIDSISKGYNAAIFDVISFIEKY